MLSEAYPTKTFTTATRTVYAIALAEISDDDLGRGVERLLRDRGRKFFPTTGELLEASAPPAEVVDVSDTLRRIDRLGTYLPSAGHIPPRVETVRAALGDPVADAYAEASPSRLFSDDPTTREIAVLAFAKAIAEGRRRLAISGPRRIAGPDEMLGGSLDAATVAYVTSVAESLTAPSTRRRLAPRQ